MALCHRVFIAVAAVTLFALPYLRRAVVGTSCNAHASVVVVNAAANSQCAAAGFAIRSGVHSVRGGIWKPSLDASGQLDLQFTARGATDTSLRRSAGRAPRRRPTAALRDGRGARAAHARQGRADGGRADGPLALRDDRRGARRRLDVAGDAIALALCARALWSRRTAEGSAGAPAGGRDGALPLRVVARVQAGRQLLGRATHAVARPETCTERLRLYNDTAEPLRAAALPRERTAARALARYARLELERLAAAMRAESDLCFHDASVVVVYEGCPQAGSPLRAAVHLLDLDKLLSCSEVRKGARDLRLRPGEAGAQVSLPVALCAGVHLLRGGDRDVASESGAAV